MLDDLLDQLANRRGIGETYYDYRGELRSLSAATKTAILAAMGCEVTDAEQPDRVTIKLESGRLVELHTGLITVEQREVLKTGKRVYAVTIRRRRGGS